VLGGCRRWCGAAGVGWVGVLGVVLILEYPDETVVDAIEPEGGTVMVGLVLLED